MGPEGTSFATHSYHSVEEVKKGFLSNKFDALIGEIILSFFSL